MRKFKRGIVISDFHCGHKLGLTLPKYLGDGPLAQIRKVYWHFFAEEVKRLKPIDFCIINGDCIDGKGEKSGGNELLTTDRKVQADMAQEVIEFIGAREKFIARGTTYHTGDEENWEDVIADAVGAEICDHGFLDVNGLIIDYRHHVGSSSIPHGRGTPIAKERLWNFLQTEYQAQPKADVIIRSHVHYFYFCGGVNWLAMTTPALQGPGSTFGARRCSGTTDFGFLHFDIVSKKEYTWEPHILAPRESAAKVRKI